MKAVILTFDFLPISFLGCYGHSLVKTPHFDQLASRSIVYDQHFAENIDPAAPAHAWTTGCYHFPRSAEIQQAMPDVGDVLNRAGIETTLISENDSHTPAANCRTAVRVEGEGGLAVSPEATPFAQLVSQAELAIDDEWCNDSSSQLLWLHSTGVSSEWLPPRAFARAAMSRSFAAGTDAEDEQSLPDIPAESSNEQSNDSESLDSTTDSEADATEVVIEDLPDESFDDFVEALVGAALDESGAANLSVEEWQVARAVLAGYVEMLDRSLGRLLAAINERAGRDPILFIVTAAEGIPAGERSMMSLPAVSLPEEIIHTPLFVQHPGAEPGTRRQQLVQTVDLVPTLLDWFQADASKLPCEGQSLLPSTTLTENREREYICLGDGTSNCAIRTRERYLILDPASDKRHSITPQLFVKPDDIWEANEVSAQSPAEVETLATTLEHCIEQAQNHVPAEFPKLTTPQIRSNTRPASPVMMNRLAHRNRRSFQS